MPLTRAPTSPPGTLSSPQPSSAPTGPGSPIAGGCCSAPAPATAGGVVIAAGAMAPDDRFGLPAIAGTSESGAVPERVEDWRTVLGRATSRGPVPGGVMLTFGPEPDLVAGLARLAVAEQACCSFFDFALAITSGGVRFEVRAPREAHEVLLALFGPPGDAA